MKQLLQSLKTGETQLIDVPCPQIKKGYVLINSKMSLISAGTEKMIVDFGKSGYLKKAKEHPDKIRQVIDKVRNDGLIATIDAVKTKLEQAIPLGYSNVGIVENIYNFNNTELKINDRVVSNGPHAEVVCVAKNLCAKIPDNVSDEEAAFTVIGSIALQGVRLLKPTIGECFVVTGLGLIGLCAVQLLKANSCKVLALDSNTKRLDLAEQFGAEPVDITSCNPIEKSNIFSHYKGVDGVIITAATKNNEPVNQAAKMCRKRGRIILTGVSGLKLNRQDFYEKEISFQVSCSYGPGRYDTQYEDKGIDYPIGYVRWTQLRNFETILSLIADKKLNFKPLISHYFDFHNVKMAYDLISQNKQNYLGIILKYNNSNKQDKFRDTQSLHINVQKNNYAKEFSPKNIIVGIIGAGNFSGRVLLPLLHKENVRLKTIASLNGVNASYLGNKFDIEKNTTNLDQIFNDDEINTVIIATRHDSHASLVCRALKKNKNVFVEKPLCINQNQLNEITKIEKNSLLMVGFNRRFAPLVEKIKTLLKTEKNPKSFIMTVNAGEIDSDHWLHDPKTGGGRIIGEACHFIDLLRYLACNKIVKHDIYVLKSNNADTVSISLLFADGSIGSIHYFSNGHKSVPKERLEVYSNGKILQLDNFKTLKSFGFKKFNKLRLFRQDKGHGQELKKFFTAILNGLNSPIEFTEIKEVMESTISLSLKAN